MAVSPVALATCPRSRHAASRNRSERADWPSGPALSFLSDGSTGLGGGCLGWTVSRRRGEERNRRLEETALVTDREDRYMCGRDRDVLADRLPPSSTILCFPSWSPFARSQVGQVVGCFGSSHLDCWNPKAAPANGCTMRSNLLLPCPRDMSQPATLASQSWSLRRRISHGAKRSSREYLLFFVIFTRSICRRSALLRRSMLTPKWPLSTYSRFRTCWVGS